MRFFPVFVTPRAGLFVFTAAFVTSLLGVSAVCDKARASGPVERMIQVLNDPSDPNHVVVRYGVATQGYLFSRDGGRTFKAMCSQAIAPTADDKILRITGQRVPGAAATLLDAQGKLLVSQLGGLWTDDGTGCSWSKQPALEGMWPYSIRRDPKNESELIAVVNVSMGDGDARTSRSSLMRRDATGTWSSAGLLKKDQPNQRVYGNELVAAVTATGTRLYTAATISVGEATAPAKTQIVFSDDGGKTWSEGSPLSPEHEEGFVLLAVDPLEPKRLLAVLYRDNASDTLLISDDEGKTLRTYADIRETSGVTFGPDGRVYIGDAGDSSGDGGVWTASRLGEPLELVEGTTFVDCIEYKADAKKLQVCRRDKFGLMDPTTGAFEELTSFEKVPALIDCPGTDMYAACSTQLNAGPSWCCTGHYPFTPFCGEYDVTMRGTQRVFCGLSGREYDRMSGRGPDAGATAVSDAGTGSRDARVPVDSAGPTGPALVEGDDEEPPRIDGGKPSTTANTSDSGCACAAGAPGGTQGFGGTLALILSVLTFGLARSRRLLRVRPAARSNKSPHLAD